MGAAIPKLNSYERVLFAIAVVIGGVLVVIRLGMIASVWYLHHAR